jgi:hypothetical protein
MDKWSDEDLQMMALWGNARANAYHLKENAVKHRYWGANIPWTVSPDMSRKDRERLVYHKYVLRAWVSKLETWALEMKKIYPLSKDERTVLDYVNGRNIVKPPKLTAAANPDSRSNSEARMRLEANVSFKTQEPKTPTKRYHSSRSRDTRWSDEIVCDGRSVMIAKVTKKGNRAPQLLEKVINDGRARKRDLSVTRICLPSPESTLRPSKPSDASKAEKGFRQTMPPTRNIRPLRPIPLHVPPMVEFGKSKEKAAKASENTWVDIVTNGLPCGTEVKTSVGHDSIENRGARNQELWEIM